MDYTKAIEIAEDIYWVGYVIPNDPFQCHVYLIKNGDESILIDPGSMITFPIVLEKITSLVSLKDIKYIIMHHQVFKLGILKIKNKFFIIYFLFLFLYFV